MSARSYFPDVGALLYFVVCSRFFEYSFIYHSSK